MLNCRKIDESCNCLEGIHKNVVFLMVWSFIFVAQLVLGQ